MPMDGVPASSASSPSAAQRAPANTTEGNPGQPQARAPEPKKDADGNPYKGTKHKLNVNGREREYDYDEVVSRAQKAEAAEEKFQRASQIEKDVETFFENVAAGDENAWGKLKKRVPPHVYKEIVLKEAWQMMEYDSLPPEKKKEMELQSWEERLKADEASKKEVEQKKVWQSQVNQAGEAINQLIEDFKDRSGKQPTSAEMMRMTEYMLAHSQRFPGELPDVEKLYERSARALEIDARDFLGKKAQNIQELMKWIPPEIQKALKKHFQDEAIAGHPKRYGSQGDEEAPRSRKESKSIGIDALFEKIDKKYKGRR